jgi:D-beta-D-heptose 7-phosphate kinase/D-beta-D-heptose 1-phosphate adenosyltransferase
MKLPSFDQGSVLTIGDAMLDKYWQGDTRRISAEAPIPVVDVTEVEERLGGAANVALNVAALGARSGLVAVAGQDESALLLQNKLNTAGISHRLVQLAEFPTITKLRIVSRKQQLLRADFEGEFEFDSEQLLSRYEDVAADFEAVILSDYDKGTLRDPQAIIASARQAGKIVLVDPKFKDFDVYRGATVLKPNLLEFERAVGSWSNEAELVSKALDMIRRLDLQALLVTRHSEGMTLVQKEGTALHLPARAHEVYDVSGAGDTVIAVVAAALTSGMSLADAIGLATYAAGIVVTRSGTASVSEAELRLEMADELGFGNGVISVDQLTAVVAEARRNGERIVFTNGCFDILHAGHVGYLSDAKECGDRLIVAVNEDASVTRLKGEGRPINTVDRRMTMLSGLKAVDWVLSFPDDTPETLLQALKPDVLVKGGDYGIDEVVGAELVKAYGGEVKVLSLVEGTSTSQIADKIKQL